MDKLGAFLTLLVVVPLLYLMVRNMVRDTWAMIKAPKGRKIEAYYTSAKGYNPFTGEPGRKLK